jgi:hypothetical protein
MCPCNVAFPPGSAHTSCDVARSQVGITVYGVVATAEDGWEREVYDDRHVIDSSPRAYALAVNVLMWAMSR